MGKYLVYKIKQTLAFHIPESEYILKIPTLATYKKYFFNR
jgi:hypothetical protein